MPYQPTYRKYIGMVFYLSFLVLGIGCNQQATEHLEATSTTLDSVQILIAQSELLSKNDPLKSALLNKASKKARKTSNDSLKCKQLTDISLQLLRTNDTSQFRNLNREAMQFAKRIKDSTYLPNLHWDLAAYFEQKTVLDSAFYHYGKAEKIFTALRDNANAGKILNQMAWAQNHIGDYTGSDITITKAIEKLKPLNKFNDLYKSYTLLGDNAKLLFEFDRSLENYNHALDYLKKDNGSPFKVISFNNNFGLVYQKNDAHDKAIPYFIKVLAIDSLQHKRPSLYGRVLNNLAYSYLKTNNFEQLPMLFFKAIHIQDSIGDLAGKTSATHRLAEYFLIKKDTSKALLHLQVAKTYATQQRNNKKLVEILRIYPKLDPKNASQHAAAAFALSDSLQIVERQIRNKFARISFETDEFIAENILLERQKQLWTGIAAALLLLGFSAFIIIRQRAKNQRLRFKQEQQASNQEIFNLLLAQNEKVEEGKKLEQKRVSEELHDGVLGRMLGARMMLLGLNKKSDPEAIAQRGRAISTLQDVEGEVRSISHELSHAAYQKIHNFILSIKDLLQTVENASKINIAFSFAEDLDYDALTGEIKINLYRIIQESIQNAVKHAECKHITVNFGADATLLKVFITDDGKGFDVKKGRKGIGTRNIRSRVKKVNGTWHIDSVIGSGTTVTLDIPIVANDNSTTIKIKQEELQNY